MRRHRTERSIAVLLLVMGLVACATTNADLERVRAAYAETSGDPDVTRYAPVALYEAEKELRRAEQAWEKNRDGDETAHRAYLAEKRLEIARVSAQGARAREDTKSLHAQREQVLLQARTHEVGRALATAEAARLEAEKRAEEAERARREAELAAERARQLEQTLAELEAKQTERGIVLTLGDVLFDFDRATLKAGARQNLQRLVAFLADNPEREVLIEGHTDSVGSDSYNQELSLRRSEAVLGFLTQNGIARQRLLARGYGENHPVVSNDTPEGRQRNRRVEVVILDPGKRAVDHVRPPAATNR